MKRYYVGGMRRQMAKEQGLSLSEFNALGEKGGYVRGLARIRHDVCAENLHLRDKHVTDCSDLHIDGF